VRTKHNNFGRCVSSTIWNILRWLMSHQAWREIH
jgi:hypothetical protein